MQPTLWSPNAFAALLLIPPRKLPTRAGVPARIPRSLLVTTGVATAAVVLGAVPALFVVSGWD
jgi:hypothetical protein